MRARGCLVVGALFCLAVTPLAARGREPGTGRRVSSRVPTALTTADLTEGVTPEDLVSALLGPDITAFNVSYLGADVSAGTFEGGLGIIGFDGGIILSSGCISNIQGPNLVGDISCDNLGAGDPDLDTLSGFETFDATVLEFDFVPSDPSATTLLFSYVFASDEYNEWVYTEFNDVFAFFVNGENCALVPGTGSVPAPVTINTVNGGAPFGDANARNPELYRNNDLDDGGGTIDTEMDGLTVVVSCQAAITPNVTNHIKLAVADASDAIYDSNVMILGGSFASTDLVVTLVPPSAVNPVGTSHTVTATVVDSGGEPQSGLEIDFTVISGPNAGATGLCSPDEECLTGIDGSVSFTYVGGPEPGLDILRACFDDAGGNDNCSPGVTKLWVLPCGADGTPCGAPPTDCEIQNTCLDGLCHNNGFEPNGSACDDLDPCTADEICEDGLCLGTPTNGPPEVDDGVRLAASLEGAELSWNAAPDATSHDVLRGLVSELPVGPGGLDETCLGSLPATTLTLTDGEEPDPAAAFWYLIRGHNDCGEGPYGFQAESGVPTVPRESETCP